MAIYKDVEALEVVAYKGESEEFDKGVTFILEKLDTLPTADIAELKHGKWADAYVSGVHHYRCTNCGEYIEATWTANFDYNYCPNCGADMRGGKTE